jgi:DNA-directed RNA polymerase specialized sigma24 family protein
LTPGPREFTIAPTAMAESSHDVTELLQAWSQGNRDALDRLIPLVYDELRRRAAARLRRERRDHTLEPTALVNEAYLRLVGQKAAAWQNRARAMGKRGGRWARVTLDPAHLATHPREVDVLDLDAALRQLASFDPRKSRIAELRFFGGLSTAEAGHVLAVSTATAEREWRAARAWLVARLTGRHPR